MIATVNVNRLHYYKTTEGSVTLTLTDARGRQQSQEAHTLLRSGTNYIDVAIAIADPQLWWPSGLGSQHLYRVEAELAVGSERTSYPAFDWGLRFVELDSQDKFAIVINGKRTFCKGANWVPPDATYARSADHQYEALIREARDTNFNILRIWGGGWFERDVFYETCDRYGIMVWHDFMFACAPYPDHLDWFRAEVEMEADYQTQRLRRHACVVLWCGSNENNWESRDW